MCWCGAASVVKGQDREQSGRIGNKAHKSRRKATTFKPPPKKERVKKRARGAWKQGSGPNFLDGNEIFKPLHPVKSAKMVEEMRAFFEFSQMPIEQIIESKERERLCMCDRELRSLPPPSSSTAHSYEKPSMSPWPHPNADKTRSICDAIERELNSDDDDDNLAEMDYALHLGSTPSLKACDASNLGASPQVMGIPAGGASHQAPAGTLQDAAVVDIKIGAAGLAGGLGETAAEGWGDRSDTQAGLAEPSPRSTGNAAGRRAQAGHTMNIEDDHLCSWISPRGHGADPPTDFASVHYGGNDPSPMYHGAPTAAATRAGGPSHPHNTPASTGHVDSRSSQQDALAQHDRHENDKDLPRGGNATDSPGDVRVNLDRDAVDRAGARPETGQQAENSSEEFVEDGLWHMPAFAPSAPSTSTPPPPDAMDRAGARPETGQQAENSSEEFVEDGLWHMPAFAPSAPSTSTPPPPDAMDRAGARPETGKQAENSSEEFVDDGLWHMPSFAPSAPSISTAHQLPTRDKGLTFTVSSNITGQDEGDTTLPDEFSTEGDTTLPAQHEKGRKSKQHPSRTASHPSAVLNIEFGKHNEVADEA
ncbi:hypothetical protein CYMTET_49309 [Cymbomonas tetramitiformis]|uniref:Uncharacterized protein n=1 Tax=Cymbomonas tetramitiformis TaxID=36881 RepID=A0AAE0BRS9_9CHLO|nr:hypothetical protein CYMTET_49309 [Cymbomonas tetramitiformis]